MSQYETYKNWTKEMDELHTATNDETHCRFYAILAYYMAEMSFKLVMKLAMSAVKPMLHAVVDDDIRPRDLLFSFEDWRNEPFLLFNGQEFPTFVSVSDVPFLEELTKKSADRIFYEFVATNLGADVRKTELSLCCRLSDETYDPVEDFPHDYTLRRLMTMLGE